MLTETTVNCLLNKIESLQKENDELKSAARNVIPDLLHYAATHGPGPDSRAKDLIETLKMTRQELRRRHR